MPAHTEAKNVGKRQHVNYITKLKLMTLQTLWQSKLMLQQKPPLKKKFTTALYTGSGSGSTW
jgi:hypothetical protein